MQFFNERVSLGQDHCTHEHVPAVAASRDCAQDQASRCSNMQVIDTQKFPPLAEELSTASGFWR